MMLSEVINSKISDYYLVRHGVDPVNKDCVIMIEAEVVFAKSIINDIQKLEAEVLQLKADNKELFEALKKLKIINDKKIHIISENKLCYDFLDLLNEVEIDELLSKTEA